MLAFIKKSYFLLLGLIFILGFFWKFIFGGLLVIPTDTIVGLYHPYRDFYSSEYPRGVPFENVQVTDPVRQQYPWRELATSLIKNFELPLWNQYNFSGYPLLANFQSAVFYPPNILMFVFPPEIGWSLLIISQPLLAFTFMFLFLQNLKLSKNASFIGSMGFAFSGFFVSWLEWGNVVSTGMFLPLILLSIDKIIRSKNHESGIVTKNALWGVIFLLSLVFSFFAGHLQVFFYLFLVSFAYLIFRWFEHGKKIQTLVLFFILYLLFAIITAIQWIPTLQFILLSARDLDQVSTAVDGWFVPWQNLTQFIAPDFFGNPSTLNYWGVWNYGEFIGYVGILPLIFALGAILFKRDKNILFFTFLLIAGVILAFPSIISNLPFKFSIPFISTSQPTRLMYIIDFALVVLAAFGFDYFAKDKKKLIVPIVIVGILVSLMWGYAIFNDSVPKLLKTSPENIAVTFSNLRLPTLIFAVTSILLLAFIFIRKRIGNFEIGKIIIVAIIAIFIFDIFRFADKYTVFAKSEYLYPSTKAIEFLHSREEKFRIMSTDSGILPPNFTAIHRIESVDGYDPLFTTRYAELAAAIARDDPNINPPFGFNRIITPQNYHTRMIDILNVKYILSTSEIEHTDYVKVFSEGETSIYENTKFIERAFFAEETQGASNKYDSIGKIFENKNNLSNIAIVENENYEEFDRNWSIGNVNIAEYNANKVVVNTINDGEGFLVLLDSYYPTWKASIDGKDAEILITDYNFRGIIVPPGQHEVIFENRLF